MPLLREKDGAKPAGPPMHEPDESIPILDLGPYLAGEPDADLRLAGELRRACEEIGFYFITNHGVPQSLIDAAFAETARFHAQPLADKTALLINDHMIGYLPVGYSTFRSSNINRNTKHDLNEALFIRRERAPDDPDVISRKRWRGLNQWPTGLPGFRDTMLRYFRTMEALGQKLLPVYALALGLPRDYFVPLFEGAHINLRLSHYPANAAAEDNQFGIAPHADAGFLTMLPQSAVPGLEIRTASGSWLAAPPLPGSYLVNTGDTLNRWTNGRFLSTPHRASNNSGRERYAMPFFYDPNTDTVIRCLPTCQGPDNPPKYPPQTYGDFYAWFIAKNYAHQQDAAE
jgi:isopenicillin N synthase-like dioxygenase